MRGLSFWHLSVAALLLAGSFPVHEAQAEPCSENERFVLLVHGGAGTMSSSAEVIEEKKQVVQAVLNSGREMLASGATAVDVVERSLRELEDSPLFNAGRGGIPNREGFVELDASIMRGDTLDAGAVAAVRSIKNPISAARAVMERSEHLFFVDRGAVAFAEKVGLEIVDPEYFLVPKKEEKEEDGDSKAGTVGAVVLDRCGNLAAGTSTGGYSTKTPGRVGDSPLIGAGTYARNETSAVSATGWGEYFIRYAAAYDVSALMEYKGLSVEDAGRSVLEKIQNAGATGGLIILDREGNMAWPYTSEGMLRGYVNHRDEIRIGVTQEMRSPE